MNRSYISTAIIVICIMIIGLYAMGEVNYFSFKSVTENNVTSPVVLIEKIGLEEKINNVSLTQGVMLDENSKTPMSGDVILFGHRTLQGSPFLRLDEVEIGDTIIFQWPGIGEVSYNVINKTVVPADYRLQSSESGNHSFLITCHPIGSTEKRLIIEGEMTNISGINDEVISNNPTENFSLIISGLFLIIGLSIGFIYPKENRLYILITVLVISAILIYFCFNPIPSQWIYDKIIFLNGGI